MTERYMDAVYPALDAAGIPQQVVVSLGDQHISGFDRDSLPNLVELQYIEVPPELRGVGWASKALRIAVDLADRFCVTLALTVAERDVFGSDEDDDDDDEWGLEPAELAAWYERYGFQGDRKMWRVPRCRA